MKKYLYLMIILLAVSQSVFTTGCLMVNSEFKTVKNGVLANLPVKYEREVEFSVGSISLSMLSFIADIVPDEENIGDMLSEIDRVQVGVYKPVNKPNSAVSVSKSYKNISCKLDNFLEKNEWKCFVRHREINEMTLFYVKMSDRKINDILVVAIQPDEIAIIELQGNIEKIVEYALKEQKVKINS